VCYVGGNTGGGPSLLAQKCSHTYLLNGTVGAHDGRALVGDPTEGKIVGIIGKNDPFKGLWMI